VNTPWIDCGRQDVLEETFDDCDAFASWPDACATFAPAEETIHHQGTKAPNDFRHLTLNPPVEVERKTWFFPAFLFS
jgi:hypothetical protein